MPDQKKSFIRSVMKRLGRLMPGNQTGENHRAVQMFQRMLNARDLLNGKAVSALVKKWTGGHPWPVTSGTYIVSDPSAPTAVCTLTSADLMEPLSKMKGVAIAGRLVTVNLGIEKIIFNTISNPNIRFLLVCGKESPVFHPAQALRCLLQKGVDSQKRIIDAEGHFPVLNNVGIDQINRFRKQVELVECVDEESLSTLKEKVMTLSNKKAEPFSENHQSKTGRSISPSESRFRKIRPGGQRGTPVYDPNGFFVISVEHKAGEIVVRHYLTDNTPAHEVRAKRADSIMRGLLREQLISQLSHAGYLGIELAKAETALRLNLPYEQDHPIKRE